MSAILPEYIHTCSIGRTNEILRSFGVERLPFATEYPDNRAQQPNEIYAAFPEEKAKRIAYGNAIDILES